MGNFEDDTRGEVIEEFITKWTQGAKDNIEEVYPNGKVGERGAARFKTEAGVWGVLQENKGKLAFKARTTTVFAGTGSIHEPNPPRTKAIRKVVRLESKKVGIDGAITKKDIHARYPKGSVLWKYVRVAEWDEASDNMKLSGKVGDWEEDYNKMMGME